MKFFRKTPLFTLTAVLVTTAILANIWDWSNPGGDNTPEALLSPTSTGTSAAHQASLFRVKVDMTADGKVQSAQKITIVVAPGTKQAVGYRYPTMIRIEDQTASGKDGEPQKLPIYVDVSWSQDGHVTGFDWKDLAPDHQARKTEDLWWLLSSKLTGDSMLNIAQSGKRYRFKRSSTGVITRSQIDPVKNNTSKETWELFANATASPHQLTKLLATQSHTLPATQSSRERTVTITVSIERENYPVASISFLAGDNSKANESWKKAKVLAEQKTGDYIRLNGGIVSTFNKIHLGGNRANIDELGSYLVRNARDRDIFQALADANMDEGAKADLILALQLQETPRAEQLLLQIAKTSDSQPGNALRAVVALGQRESTSVEVVQTLADLAQYKKAADLGVSNNALLQMAYLTRLDPEKYTKIVDKTLTDYSKSKSASGDLLLQAQTATQSATYRDAAIAAIPEGGSFLGKPTDPQTMTAAAKLVATQATMGDFKSMSYVKSNILTSDNPLVIPYLTSAYSQMPADPNIDAGIQGKIATTQATNTLQAYYQALSSTPERCNTNQQFLKSSMANSTLDGSIKQMLQTSCGL